MKKKTAATEVNNEPNEASHSILRNCLGTKEFYEASQQFKKCIGKKVGFTPMNVNQKWI